ncbi:MAG: DUF368 domain-containing protein [Oscillospiraceae bacterium]|nr:DUF368 domain-containing protein [Oscillospiraceae bacterium]
MSKIKTVLLGCVVGASMSVPGISGGSIAIMLGIYHRLLSAVADIQKDIKGSVTFLALFAIGGGIGLLTAARLVTWLMSTAARVPLCFAFLGAAAGCLPSIARQAGLLPVSPKKLLLVAGGAVTAALVSAIPVGAATESAPIQFIGGVAVAAALVLPGISASQMLYTMGLYEQVMYHAARLDILPLLPLAAGLIVGIFLTAKLLTLLLERFGGTFTVILGFMLFSLTELIPQWNSPVELLTGAVCAVTGFFITFLMSGKENAQKCTQDIVNYDG